MLDVPGHSSAHVDLKYPGYPEFAETQREREVSEHPQRQTPVCYLRAAGGCQGVGQAWTLTTAQRSGKGAVPTSHVGDGFNPFPSPC